MKRALLITSALIATMSFSNFSIKANAEYNNQILKNNNSNIILGGIELEYIKPVYNINDNISLIISGGLDAKFGYGVTNDLRELYTEPTLNKLIEVEKNKDRISRIENLINDFKKRISNNPQDNESRNNLILANSTLENAKKDLEKTKISLDEAIENDENIKKYKNKAKENLFKVAITPYITSQIQYSVNKNTNLRAGIKVGIGYEGTFFSGVERDEKIDVAKLNKTSIKDSDRFNYTVEKKKFEIKKSQTSALIVPITGLLGFDYKKLTTNLEIGGKYIYNKNSELKHQFAPLVGLNLGYSF
ncbi:hypothetical protein [Oceanivirga salmonicida]|uniref:hypothetical protein n=1 Tax=Oceanivirga salmonicida TaxID=1769291 RepID=UPI0012E14B19|nr:hypothetical protein [Oceanivirga salmonicida]